MYLSTFLLVRLCMWKFRKHIRQWALKKSLHALILCFLYYNDVKFALSMDRVAMRTKVISANVQEFVSLNKALYKCKKRERGCKK